jgi:hypothetical protein
MSSFLETFSPRKAWSRLWDATRPSVMSLGERESERFEDRYRHDSYSLPTLTPGESGFGESDVGGQTPGDVGPTREMVPTSTQVPGAPPCAPEGKIANHRFESELVVGTAAAADTHVLGFVDKSNPPEKGPSRVLQDRVGRDLPRGPEGHVVIYADPPLGHAS